MDKQALQRAHRIGQMNHVLSINLVSRHTVEEVGFYISGCDVEDINIWFVGDVFVYVGHYAESREEVAA